jgi:hypothetical protein
VVKRLSARPASARGRTLLTLDRNASVLASLLVVRSAVGHPLLVVDVVVAVPPQGLDDAFELNVRNCKGAAQQGRPFATET